MAGAAELAAVRDILKSEPFVVRSQTDTSELSNFIRKITTKNSEQFSKITCQSKVSPEWIRQNAKQDIHILWSLLKDDVEGVAFIEGSMKGDEQHIDTICARPGGSQGGKLLKAVESWAFQKGAKKITLDALPSVLGFYEKMGYAQDPAVPPESQSDAKKIVQLETEFKRIQEEYETVSTKLGDYTQGVPMIKENKSAGRRRLRLKTLRKSHNKAKKQDAVFEKPDGSTKTVPFGQKGQSDYTKHKDKTRRQRQIDRHSGMGENWKDPTTPGALSRYILWNKPTLKGSLRDFKRRFHV